MMADDAAFAIAIERILSDRTWREQLGKNARQRVEAHFRWDGVAAQLSQLYEELLGKSASHKQPAIA